MSVTAFCQYLAAVPREQTAVVPSRSGATSSGVVPSNRGRWQWDGELEEYAVNAASLLAEECAERGSAMAAWVCWLLPYL